MIIRIFLLTILITVLTCALVQEYETSQNAPCLHVGHSEFDDGDGANLEFLNENFNEIHKN